MDKDTNAVKDALFDFEIVDGKKVYIPFNPRSNIAVMEYFSKQHYDVGKNTYKLTLPSNSKDNVQKLVKKTLKALKLPCADDKEKFTTDLLTDEMWAEMQEPVRHLVRLYEYKDFGKGLKAWFDEDKYKIDWLGAGKSLGLIHPRFVVPATQTGRLSSSRPNFMNIPARGWGEIVRAAVVAREKSWYVVKSDFSNLEFRMCLYLSGFDLSQIGPDAFSWLVSQAPSEFAEAAGWIGWSARDVAKSVSHAADYLEGLRLLKPYELDLPRTKAEEDAGALRIYRDWEYCGKIVAFTGGNLAERMFGNKTRANRARALKIQEDIYFKTFPYIRKWHRKVLAEAEQGRVQSATGRYLSLYGQDFENAKVAAAFHGQGTSADFVQEKMLMYWRDGVLPILQVHDELDFEVHPDKFNKKDVGELVERMQTESTRLPGFICPIKAKGGLTWQESKMERLV
jgi:hypothetical protein